MTRDRLEQDAQRLFDAARHESPSLAARERTLAALVVVPHERRQRVWRWYAALALAAGFALLALRWRAVPAETLAIGPERRVSEQAPPKLAQAVSNAVPVASDAALSEQKATRPAPSVVRQQASAAPAASVSLEQELDLLDHARNELVSGHAAQALKLLDRYRALPQAKSMGAEATLLRIQALASSGRRTEAAALARSFVSANPNSPLADRARKLVSEVEKPGGAPAASGNEP